MMKKTLIVLALVQAVTLPMFAKVCHWTGLGDNNAWTNTANWLEGEVPGIISGDGHEIASDSSDSAVFGTVAQGAHIQVDVAGQRGVSNLTFTAGAPAYEFVNTADAYPFVGSCGGSLTVESGVTSDITFSCLFFPGGWDLTFPNATKYDYAEANMVATYHPGIVYSRVYTQTHNGTGTLRYNGYWRQSYNLAFKLYGSGDISLTGNGVTSMMVENYTSGKLSISSGSASKAVSVKALVSKAQYASCTRIEMAGGIYQKNDWGNPITYDTHENNLHVTGNGIYGVLNSHQVVTSYGCTIYDSSADHTLTFDSPVGFFHDRPQYLISGGVSGKATFVFNGGVHGPHSEFWILESAKLRVPAIGEIGGDPAATGVGTNVQSIVFDNNGALEYTGAGETLTRTLGLGSAANYATVRNLGTGELTISGAVTQRCATANLRLDAQNSPIAFATVPETGKTLNLAVAGAAGVVLPRAVNVSSCRLEGGTLRFASGTGNVTVPVLVTTSGDSTVVVPEGANLTVSTLTFTAGTVNFSVPEGSTVIVPDVALTTVRHNGHPVRRNAETGALEPQYTAWKVAADGDWNTAANWSNGVPDAGFAADVTVAGGDYAVTIAATPAVYPSTFNIANAGAGTASVHATAPIALTNVATTVGAGGRLVADAGLMVTNSAKLTAVLTVSTGGVVEVTGGQLHMPCEGDVKIDGGRVEVKDEGSILLPNHLYLRNGEFAFSGEGKVERLGSGGSVTVAPNQPGTEAKFTVGNMRRTNDLAYLCVRVDGGCASSTGRVSYCATELDDAGTPRPYHLKNLIGLYSIGYQTGTAIMELSGGTIVCANPGIKVGACYMSADSRFVIAEGAAPTGIVRMTGGRLQPSGWGGAYISNPCGLIVGDGTLAKNGSQSRAFGRFELAGGTVYPNQNATIVGIGQAQGEFVQTGGSLEHSSYYTSTGFHRWMGEYEHSYPFAIGIAGGIGKYVLSNGTVKVNARHDVYVGGIGLYELSMSDQEAKYLWFNNGFDTNRHDAVGQLLVRGGTLNAEGGIVVGADGEGTLEFAAAAGAQYTVGKDIVLSNNTASTLAFTLNAAGRPNLTVGGKLIVNAGSKLKVDLADYPFTACRVCLVEPAGGVVGAFDEDDVEIIPPKASVRGIRALELVTVLDGKSGLWLQRHNGTAVILR